MTEVEFVKIVRCTYSCRFNIPKRWPTVRTGQTVKLTRKGKRKFIIEKADARRSPSKNERWHTIRTTNRTSGSRALTVPAQWKEFALDRTVRLDFDESGDSFIIEATLVA